MDSIHDLKRSITPGAPVIIDIAINGERTRDMNPNVPISADEIAEEAIACLDAGASMIHAHNTNTTLTAREGAEDYMKTWRQVLKVRPDALWYPTLVLDNDPSQSGVEHVEILVHELGLSIGCIDPGSVNIGTHIIDGDPAGILHNVSLDRISKQCLLYRQLGIGAAMGIYEPGYLRTALAYYRAGKLPKGSSLNLYFIDEYGLLSTDGACSCGFPPQPKYLDVYLSLMEGYDIPWFVSVWGRNNKDSRQLLERALSMGGHIQVGLETHYDPDRKPTNIELLKEIIAMAKDAGRPVATSSQARKILDL